MSGRESNLPADAPPCVFHVAIPTHDLGQAERFYVDVLGARRMRIYDDRVTFWLFAHQLVCHLDPEGVDAEPRVYPRHFGITFDELHDFERLHAKVVSAGYPMFRPRTTRWPDRPERHETFFLLDPSNNVIEFKCYDDPQYRY